MSMQVNRLFFGDNLPILKEHIQEETVDLVYLDPPFNSNASYNVLFSDKAGKQSEAQIAAFEDTWHWGAEAETTYDDIVRHSSKSISVLIQALLQSLGRSDMMAYLVMMAPRLAELHRVLKPTGSLYLHCDPTASHYLKLVLDVIFSPTNFINEIVWLRTASKGLQTTRLARNHDIILAYAKAPSFAWNLEETYAPYDLDNLPEKTAVKYCHQDKDGRLYRLDNLANPNHNRPNLTYEFLGITKVWRWTRERMQEAYDAGLIVQTKPGTVPQFKRYIDEQSGKSFGDVWTDIPPINSQAQERLGYPTQKPEALLERLIKLTTAEGGVILDPFCGCGTSIAVAERNHRKWIGIDITFLAVGLMKRRLLDTFGKDLSPYEILGSPKDLESARALSEISRYQFEWWAIDYVDARPAQDKKKGADKGVDGFIFFIDDVTAPAKQVLIQVKSGNVQRSVISVLKGDMEREGAPIGALITLEEPTEPMIKEALSAGFYTATGTEQRYPKVQILTIAELLNGKRLLYPASVQVTFKQAERKTKDKPDAQPTLF